MKNLESGLSNKEVAKKIWCTENQIDTVADNHDLFKALLEELSELRKYNSELTSEELTAEDDVNTDSNVITTDALKIEILES